tara:strand:+ start:1180 stop:1638 length:459 start_codon:yes stop_codon:yes gene_type:complete
MALSSAPIGKLIARSSSLVQGRSVLFYTLLHTATTDCKISVLASPQIEFNTSNAARIYVTMPTQAIGNGVYWSYWGKQGSTALPAVGMQVLQHTYYWSYDNAAPVSMDAVRGVLVQKGTKIYQRTAGNINAGQTCLFTVLEMQPEVNNYAEI